jgi:hypothetical protein
MDVFPINISKNGSEIYYFMSSQFHDRSDECQMELHSAQSATTMLPELLTFRAITARFIQGSCHLD